MMATALPLGEKGPSFENLQAADGKTYSTSSFADKRILVLVFMGNGCPTSKATEERLTSIQNDYSNKGVQLILVNSNNPSISPPDTIQEMSKRAQAVGYVFPYLKDDGSTLARTLGAQTTPHAFALDEQRRLRYKGRVDNARQKSLVTVQDLRNALDDLVAGRQVRAPENTSLGCSIVW